MLNLTGFHNFSFRSLNFVMVYGKACNRNLSLIKPSSLADTPNLIAANTIASTFKKFKSALLELSVT